MTVLLPPRRSSILDSVTLSDGRLAWPVGKSRGMHEATFRARLKRMSPDLALTLPLMPKGPSRSGERAARAFARSAARPIVAYPPSSDFSHDHYAGVVVKSANFRICVTPRGSMYFLQSRSAGSWVTSRNFGGASDLRAFCSLVMFDPSPDLLDAVSHLPDDPAAALPLRGSDA